MKYPMTLFKEPNYLIEFILKLIESLSLKPRTYRSSFNEPLKKIGITPQMFSVSNMAHIIWGIDDIGLVQLVMDD